MRRVWLLDFVLPPAVALKEYARVDYDRAAVRKLALLYMGK